MATEYHLLSFSNLFYTILKNTMPGYNGKAQCFNNLMAWSGLSVPTAQNLSPWINGKRPLPQDYKDIIQQKGYIDKVKNCIETNILPHLFNPQDVVTELSLMIDKDYRMHRDTQAKFCEHQADAAYYIALALYYVLTCHENIPVSVKQSVSRAGIRPESILLSVPKNRTPIIGRESECKRITNTLSKHGHIFLWGIAGIGKSELAKHYIHSNKESFSNTIYIPFNTSIKESIANSNFTGDNPEESTDVRFVNHLRHLYTYDTDTIILLDNFNIVPDDDPDFAALVNGKFQIIITSRNKPIDYPEYEVKELSLGNCMELFKLHAPHTLPDKQIKTLIGLAYSHTLLIVMIARTLKYTELGYEDIINALSTSIIETPTGTTIPITKDGQNSFKIYQQHLFNLIELTNLTQDELDVLSILSLMPLDGISITCAKEYTEQSTLNNINYLVRLGYVSWDEATESNLSVHPLISEIVLKKNIERMPTVTPNLISTFLKSVYKENYYPDIAEQRIAISIFDWITSCQTQNYCRVVIKLAGFFLKYGQFYYVTEASNYIDAHTEILSNEEFPYVKALAAYYQGITYSQLSDDKLARPYFETAANCLQDKTNATPDELELYYNALIEAAACIEDPNDSIAALEQIKIPEESLIEGTQQSIYARMLFKLAYKYILIDNMKEADTLFRICLDKRILLYGPDSVYVGLALGNIGFIYQTQKEYFMASNMYQYALEVLRRHLPENHINIVRLYANLGACYKAADTLFSDEISTYYFSIAQQAANMQITKESEIVKDKTEKSRFQRILDAAMTPLLKGTASKIYKAEPFLIHNTGIRLDDIEDFMHPLPNHPIILSEHEKDFHKMADNESQSEC